MNEFITLKPSAKRDSLQHKVILTEFQPARSYGFSLLEHMPIQEVSFLPNTTPRHIGNMRFGLYYDGDKSILYFEEFYPFSRPKIHTTNVSEELKVLIGKGIADRLNYLAILNASKIFPDTLITAPNPSKFRRKQERRLGLEPCREYRISEYLGIIEKHIPSKWLI